MNNPLSRNTAEASLGGLLVCLCALTLDCSNLHGQVDSVYKPPVIEGGLLQAADAQPDGKLLVAGWFTSINGTPATGIARLNTDGTLDTTFTPPLFENSGVGAVLLLPDGGCFIAGSFQVRTGAVTRVGMAKLTSSGAIDLGFPNLRELGGQIWTAALDPNGKILLGGEFLLTRTRTKANLMRLLPTGVVDDSLFPTANSESTRPTVNGSVRKIITLPDGRILIGGAFTKVGSVARPGVALLHNDGSVDISFDFTVEHDCCIQDLMLEAGGRVLVAGSFTNFAGLGRSGIVRLTPDGGLDLSFLSLAGPISDVQDITQSVGEQIILAGTISQPAGTNFLGLIRLFSDGEMDTTLQTSNDAPMARAFVVNTPPGPHYSIQSILNPLTGTYRSRIDKIPPIEPAGTAPQILLEPSDVLIRERMTLTLQTDHVAHPRPMYQWAFNGSDLAGATNRFLKLPDIRVAQGGEYQLIIQNHLGRTSSRRIRVEVQPRPTGPGHLDLEYDLGRGINGIGSAQELADGKVLITGGFDHIGGLPRSRLARLNSDGTVDPSFVPQTSEFNYINSAQVSINETVVVLGTVLNGQRSKMVRLTAEGNVDPAFKAFLSPSNYIFPTMHVQTNGYVYVAGNYVASFTGVFRLQPDGARDTSYRLIMDSVPTQITGLPDSKVMLLGYFNAVAGIARSRLARLNADGTLDETFIPEPIFEESNPEKLAVQPDGKILVTGQYYGPGRIFEGGGLQTWHSITRLSRFNADGSLEQSFLSELDERMQVTALKVQSNGGILLATIPFDFPGVPTVALTRLFPDGSLDHGFHQETEADGSLSVLASLANNRLLVGGGFFHIAGMNRNGLALIFAHSSPPTAPVIIRPPVESRVPEGANLLLDPSVHAVPAASYQWQKDSLDLPGETNRLLILKNLSGKDMGSYRIVAKNTHGAATSANAFVQVDPTQAIPGHIDTSFYTGDGPNGAVNQVVELSDGKVLIAGNFTFVDHQLRPRIARLHADGSLDQEFSPTTGPNAEITCLVVLDDGQIIIGGPFDRIGSTNRPSVAALNTDGTLNLANEIAADGRVTQLVAKDGKVLGCGAGFVRCWNPDGSDDSTFSIFRMDGIALALELQADKKIVVAGAFGFDGATRPNIARLNPDGSRDTTFKVGSGADDRIDDVAIQSDGKILVVGAFTTFDSVPRGHLARLNGDGSLDATFSAGIGAQGGRMKRLGHFGMRDITAIHSIALDANDSMVIGGEFATYENLPNSCILRLYPDGAIDQNFRVGAGFPSPEGRFQTWYSEDGLFAERWITRIDSAAHQRMFALGNFPGMNGVSRPRMIKLRGGEPAAGAPEIRSQRTDIEARTGTNVLFYVEVLGFPRPAFQWLRDGQALPGATDPSLFLTNIGRQEQGEYTCIISNSLGSIHYAAGVVSVIPPRKEPGAIDIGFYANLDPNLQITSASLEIGGQIQLAGNIQHFNRPSQPWWTRLKSDGSTETVFDPEDFRFMGGSFLKAVTLADGRILLSGWLDVLSGNGESTQINWLRLHSHGTIDSSYTPPKNVGLSSVMIRLANGKIFGIGNAGSRPRVFRLQTDGTLDGSFVAMTSFDNPPQHIVEDLQGRLLIGGDFTSVGGQRRNRIVRLNSDGSVDSSFDVKNGPDGSVTGIGLQPDGRILISGWFNAVRGTRKPRLARLDDDGTVDLAYPRPDLPLENATIMGMATMPDGKVILSGLLQLPLVDPGVFQIIRLDADGAVDPTLSAGCSFEWINPGRFGSFSAPMSGLTPTGKLIVTGAFQTVDGLPRTQIVRLLTEADPRLGIQATVSSTERRWLLLWDEGILEESTALFGPWQTVQGATNPWRMEARDNRNFFRLKLEP